MLGWLFLGAPVTPLGTVLFFGLLFLMLFGIVWFCLTDPVEWALRRSKKKRRKRSAREV